VYKELSSLRFVMYTDKTVSQAMSAINERLHAPPSKSRPQLDGWVEKNGRFAISTSSKLRWRFSRRTHLYGKAERQSGVTVIEGNVPGGVSHEGQAVIFGALLLVGLLIFFIQGNALFAIVAVMVGMALFIPLRGDYHNSEILLSELQKTLNARLTPPKKMPTKR
jgi:hypothetical protein